MVRYGINAREFVGTRSPSGGWGRLDALCRTVHAGHLWMGAADRLAGSRRRRSRAGCLRHLDSEDGGFSLRSAAELSRLVEDGGLEQDPRAPAPSRRGAI